MATYDAELAPHSADFVTEALKDPREGELGYGVSATPALVYGPALVCYGGGTCAFGFARVSAADYAAEGGGSCVATGASVSAGVISLEGVGEALFSGASAGPVEVEFAGAGGVSVGRALIAAMGEFSGDAALIAHGARLHVGDVVVSGGGTVELDPSTVIPKGAPGRVTLTARPTASVVAWAVPR